MTWTKGPSGELIRSDDWNLRRRPRIVGRPRRETVVGAILALLAWALILVALSTFWPGSGGYVPAFELPQLPRG